MLQRQMGGSRAKSFVASSSHNAVMVVASRGYRTQSVTQVTKAVTMKGGTIEDTRRTRIGEEVEKHEVRSGNEACEKERDAARQGIHWRHM
jgi:hypothetical protein